MSEIVVRITPVDPIVRISLVALNQVAAGGVSFALEQFSGDGSETEFTLAQAFTAGSCSVYRNGVLQDRGGDYTENVGRTAITFINPPDDGDNIDVRYAY